MDRTRGDLEAMGLAVQGKLSVIIDGQFGSCGKGLAASLVGMTERLDVAVATCSPNAGHTFHDADGRRHVAHHLPVSGLATKDARRRCVKLLCAGSIVEPMTFLDEIERMEVDPDTVFVHPRAAVVEAADVAAEKAPGSATERLASTGKGGGSALARKVMREARLAGEHPLLKPFCADVDLTDLLERGSSAVIEVPQGYGLGLNSGYAYPHVTSREVTVASALADAQVHPVHLGRTLMCVRTFPIRVGHVLGRDGAVIGRSGPFPEDSRETSWQEIGVPPETTTVTGRVRRVATFSTQEYARAARALRPDLVLLNFANYLRDPEALEALLAAAEPYAPVTHLGFGPRAADLVSVERWRREVRALPAP